MKISKEKLLVLMARQAVNPYGLCDKAGICYASYRRITNGAICKPATIGKIARALGVDVTEIIDTEE